MKKTKRRVTDSPEAIASPVTEAGGADKRIELAALSVKQTTARCRVLGSEKTILLRAGSVWEIVPGEIALVHPRKQWIYGGTPYVSGAIESVRIDPAALGLVPLKLQECGMWDPAGHY